MHKLTKWLNKILFVIAIFPFYSLAQTINLQQVYDLAEKNYPLIKQRNLIQQTRDIQVTNISKGYLPQINVGGQLSYQSDVTKITIPIPGFVVDPLSKDQYRITTEISQLLFDGGLVNHQKQIQNINAEVENQKVEVELYKLKEKLTQLFLGVLYLNEQLKQIQIVKKDLQNGIEKIQALVDNGVALKSNVHVFTVELLKTNQKEIEIQFAKKGLIAILETFTKTTFPENVVFIQPFQENKIGEIQRPELSLFLKQKELLNLQKTFIKTKTLPKATAFALGGYGRPGLNMLKNSFDWYGIVGLKLNWNISSFYTSKKEKQLVEVNKKMVEVQQELFMLNTNSQIKNQHVEIVKWEQLIRSDNEIISLRKSIKNAAKVQLENAVITASDYIREINAEDLAKQNLITHQIQLLQAKINLNLVIGQQ